MPLDPAACRHLLSPVSECLHISKVQDSSLSMLPMSAANFLWQDGFAGLHQLAGSPSPMLQASSYNMWNPAAS